jgi:hypothetical protein
MLDRVIGWVRLLVDAEGWWFRLFAPSWQVRKTDRSTSYSGEFAVWDRARHRPLKVQGRIVEWPGLGSDVYVYDPPEWLRRHEHGRCLQLLLPDDKWFRLHWTRPGRTFNETKEYVEQMLWEALYFCGR